MTGRALSFQDLASQLHSPEEIAHFMWKHFVFEKDQRLFGEEEYWQSPEEFFENRKGDCEDFALFAQAILKTKGVTSFLMNIYGSQFAHTVLVFKEDGKYNVVDGTKVKRYEAEGLRELADKIHPKWDKSAIVKPAKESKHGQILAQFAKEAKIKRSMRSSA